jgi:hypothetical protein
VITLTEQIIRKHARELRKKANVVGWGRELRPRIRGGVETGEMAFRVYVSKKAKTQEEKIALSAKDLVPSTLEGVPTDVVEVGVVKAVATDRKGVVRPVPLGVSISNYLVTSGTLGMLYEKDGVTYAGSNAHIVSPSPFLAPSAVVERRILQPGSLYGGKLDVNVVGEYAFHTQLYPVGSDQWGPLNWFGYLMWQISQWFRQVAGAKAAAAGRVNLLDFGVYRVTKPHISSTVDDALGVEPFVGHLLAASDQVGVVCKSKHVEALGYKPVIPSVEAGVGDTVKGASYWGDFETTVLDDGAEILVSYDDYSASLSDIILLRNAVAPDGKPFVRGGCSGMGYRLIKRA